MHKIFVSYSRHSEATARKIVADLESLGHAVRYDREVAGGQPWWEQILESIRRCTVVLFVLDPHSLTSVACSSERRYGLALNKPLLPVRATDAISIALMPP